MRIRLPRLKLPVRKLPYLATWVLAMAINIVTPSPIALALLVLMTLALIVDSLGS